MYCTLPEFIAVILSCFKTSGKTVTSQQCFVAITSERPPLGGNLLINTGNALPRRFVIVNRPD